MTKEDINTEEDVTMLVHSFYKKVKQDDLLAPVFNIVIKGSWEVHLQKMCDFWCTLLLGRKKYLSDPMSKHLPLPISKVHFSRWLFLFEETIDELYTGENALEAKRRAQLIANVIQHMKEVSNE